MWEDWGREDVLSDYKKFPEPTEEQQVKNWQLKMNWKHWVRGKATHIADMVKADCRERGAGHDQAAEEIRNSDMMSNKRGEWELHRRAHAEIIMKTLTKTFGNPRMAEDLLYHQFPLGLAKRKRADGDGNDTSPKGGRADILGNPRRLSSYIQEVLRLVMWL